MGDDRDMAFFRAAVGAGVLVLAAMVLAAVPTPSAIESLFLLLVVGVGVAFMLLGGWGLLAGGDGPRPRAQG